MHTLKSPVYREKSVVNVPVPRTKMPSILQVVNMIIVRDTLVEKANCQTYPRVKYLSEYGSYFKMRTINGQSTRVIFIQRATLRNKVSEKMIHQQVDNIQHLK